MALKADAFLTELDVGADDRVPNTTGDAQRLWLMLEGRTAWAVSEETHPTLVFEFGRRWDGDKVETGVGAELGGRMELGEWVDLSVEGECTTQGSGAEHQVALYGQPGW